MSKTALRVLTMNVLEPQYADGAARRRVLADAVAAADPDVLALQEVVPDDARRLAADGWNVLPHPHTSSDGPDGPDGPVGALLAVRAPLGRVRTDALQVSERTARTPWCGVVAAEVTYDDPLGGVLLVHHKPSWPYGFEAEREAQARAAAVLAEEMLAEGKQRVRHAVLLGDLDAGPEAASLRFLRGAQSLDGVSVCYQDAWEAAHPDLPGHTFTPANPLVRAGDMPLEPGRRIDHVMARCGLHGPTLRVVTCELFLAEPVAGVQASDHYGVLADFAAAEREPGAGGVIPGRSYPSSLRRHCSTFRARIPRVARRPASGMTGKMPASRYRSSISLQS
ncbi:endonuclease/exonuclease/phosphatase family protein [Streptomyces sp. Je 1-332]|uniref:endonuclease/exonuclease/phosphatase family protein n=1 Tax=Streptomyces sp. Je 1-332 TaxID=3231270 RepID=UPI00345AC571